jgi:hypothetical protein
VGGVPAEQRDDAVDVDEQEGPYVVHTTTECYLVRLLL